MSKALTAVLLVLLAGPAIGGQLDASWIAPTTNTDGSPITGSLTYKVYWALFPQIPCPGTQFIVTNPDTTSALLSGLTAGMTYNAQVTAVNTSNNESGCSLIASAAARPDPLPINVTGVQLVFTSPSGPMQVVLDTDSFNGTNGTILSSYSVNWPVWANWNGFVAIEGSPGVGEIVNGGVSANRRTGQAWTNDQWAEITISILPEVSLMVGVRMRDTSPAGDGYFGGWGVGENYNIRRCDPSSSCTILSQSSLAPQAGDVINVQVVGTTITLLVTRGITQTLISATDSTLTTGTPGLLMWDSGGHKIAGVWRAGKVQ